jgi:hypothetical protein
MRRAHSFVYINFFSSQLVRLEIVSMLVVSSDRLKILCRSWASCLAIKYYNRVISVRFPFFSFSEQISLQFYTRFTFLIPVPFWISYFVERVCKKYWSTMKTVSIDDIVCDNWQSSFSLFISFICFIIHSCIYFFRYFFYSQTALVPPPSSLL